MLKKKARLEEADEQLHANSSDCNLATTEKEAAINYKEAHIKHMSFL